MTAAAATRRAALRRGLLPVVAAAADPRERAVGRWCRPVETTAGRVADRRDRWMEAVAAGDRAAFGRLLDRRGIDPRRLDDLLVDVEVRPGATLPPWARAIEWLLAGRVPDVGLGQAAAGAPDGRRPRRDVATRERWRDGLELFRRPAIDHVRDAAHSVGVEASDDAVRDLVEGLHRRLARVTLPALTSPPRVGGSGDLLAGLVDEPVLELYFGDGGHGADPAAWLDLFRLYPVLARVIGVAWSHWTAATNELLRHLGEDRAALAAAWADGGDLGPLAGVVPDVGDLHRGGRAVALLAFGNGLRLVHKPRDLRVAAAFQELVARLQDHPDPLPIPLAPRTVLVRGDHAWEREVVDTGCADRDAVRRHYVRYGVLARLLVLLGGHDLTLDNIRAAGEHPVVVDLETLLRPLPRSLTAEPPDDGGAHAAWWRSAAPTGLFTCHVEPPPSGATSASPLSPLGEAVVPAPVALDSGAGVATDRATRAAWLPAWRGEPVDPRDFHDDVLAGYAGMSRWLHAHGDWVTGSGGPLDGMAVCTVRFLHRGTGVYQRVLDRSLDPACLRDGVSRELVLERLWRTPDVDPAAGLLVASEIEALRDLDVPLLTCRSDARTVELEDGRQAEMFTGTGLQRARASLSPDPARAAEHAQADVALAASLLYCLDPRPRPGRGPSMAPGSAMADADRATARPVPPGDTAAGPPAGSIPGPDRCLDAATRIAHEIRGHALRSGTGVGWIGLQPDPAGACWDVTPLAPDLLDGTAGLAVVLAEIAVQVDDRSLTDLTSDLVGVLVGRLQDWAAIGDGAGPDRHPDRASPRVGGGLTGPWSLVHGLARVATVTRDDELLALVAAAASGLDPESVPRSCGAGLVDGRAGLVLNLLAVHRRAGDDRLLRLAVAVAPGPAPDGPGGNGSESPADEAGAGAGRHGLVHDELPPAGLAVRDARGRLARGAPAADTAPPAAGRRGDAATGSDRFGPVGRGQLLGRIAVRTATGVPDPSLTEALDRHLRQEPDTTRDLLGQLEVAVTAIERLGSDHGARALRLVDDLLRRRRGGSWFPELRVDDRHNLSAVHGLGALALALSRLADPGPPRSLRLLD